MGREPGEGPTLAMRLLDVRHDPPEGPFRPVRLVADRGTIACRHDPAPGSTAAALFVGGVGGGFDTPCRGQLDPSLAEELPGLGIAALRGRYRHATDLDEAALDVLAGVQFLLGQGAGAVGLVGHSSGGAVVARAAAASEAVRGVVALSTQGYGVEPIADLGPRCTVLLLHGLVDEILSPECSRYAYRLAREPRALALLPGARQWLSEAAELVRDTVRDWLVDALGPRAGASRSVEPRVHDTPEDPKR